MVSPSGLFEFCTVVSLSDLFEVCTVVSPSGLCEMCTVVSPSGLFEFCTVVSLSGLCEFCTVASVQRFIYCCKNRLSVSLIIRGGAFYLPFYFFYKTRDETFTEILNQIFES